MSRLGLIALESKFRDQKRKNYQVKALLEDNVAYHRIIKWDGMFEQHG
jgi:hypothetical protein